MKQPRNQKLSFQRAIDKMALGAKLMLMHDPKADGGQSYYLVPGGPVHSEIAHKLIAHATVRCNDDGLFPDSPQSWSVVT